MLFPHARKRLSLFLLLVTSLFLLATFSITRTTAGPPDDRARPTPRPDQLRSPDPHKQLAPRAPLGENSATMQSAITPCANGMAGIYPCKGIDLLARVPLASLSSGARQASSIWGYTDLDDNREYAIIGLDNGTTVVEITDPVNPRVVGFISGISSIWREMKVYQFRNVTSGKWDAYAYITTEGANGGIQIINLSNLPSSISLASTWRGISTSHTVLIGNVDWYTGVANHPTLQPILFINGPNIANGMNTAGFRMVSLADPVNLQQAGTWNEAYTHDMYMQIFTGSRAAQCAPSHDPCEVVFSYSGYSGGLKIIDVTEKSRPVTLSTLTYPNTGYTHSGWATKDANYLFIMDERDEADLGTNTLVRTVNISNLRSPVLSGGWSHPDKSTEHNGYVIGDKYYMSHFTRGVVILDVANPSAPREAAYFDSYPTDNSAGWSYGPWGVFPYFRSGTIIASDFQNGLLILREQSSTLFADDFETNRSWQVNSTGTDSATLGQWERADPEATDYQGPKQLGITTSGLNDLVTGRLAGSDSGSYDLDGGLSSIRSPSITLPQGSTPTLQFNYYLAHANNASSEDFLRVKVIGNTTSTLFEKLGAAADMDAFWQTANINLSAFAGQNVHIQIEASDAGTGSLLEAAVDDVRISAPALNPLIFSDTFETSTGWTSNPSGSDTATLGRWERGDPEATDYDGPKQLGTTFSGVNDLVTGRLAGAGSGEYDVDGGVTSIRSPGIVLPSGRNLTLRFTYYLAHANNAGSDDYIRVKVIGSTTSTVFEKLGAASDVDAAWQTVTVNLSSFAGQTVRIQIEAADSGTGSLIEAAVDDLSVMAN